MTPPEPAIPEAEREPPAARAARQAARLKRLLLAIHGRNRFYTRKLDAAGIDPAGLVLPRDLAALPLTTKAELIADQDAAPPWGTVLTYPVARYTRYNQTSSTTGRPLRWLDTTKSWQWMLDCWQAVYRGARVSSDDRILFPFSFGPFLGFWTAFDAGARLGAHCVPAGGMTSEARLALLDAVRPTVVCCTPTYALRLAEAARAVRRAGPALADSPVRVLIVAGEPGGSIPATRRRIEQAWGARVIDHHGLTEVGPVSFECWENPGAVHLNECEFICEVLDPETGRPAPAGRLGELVLTNLGRTASPLIRYRTGDLVALDAGRCACGRTFARLDGGIRARIDDMIHVNGVNVYPAAIEAVVRTVGEVVEYRATVHSRGALRTVAVEAELDPSVAQPDAVCRRVEQGLRAAFGLTIPVTAVAAGALPRFDMKAKRCVVVP